MHYSLLLTGLHDETCLLVVTYVCISLSHVVRLGWCYGSYWFGDLESCNYVQILSFILESFINVLFFLHCAGYSKKYLKLWCFLNSFGFMCFLHHQWQQDLFLKV